MVKKNKKNLPLMMGKFSFMHMDCFNSSKKSEPFTSEPLMSVASLF